MEKSELEHLATEEGIPADFDVAQINWKPHYDPFYYQQLLVRAERIYLFRDQYLFLFPSAIVAETPQAGHATYLFSRPENINRFFHLYAPSTREAILKNRNNSADKLGYLGRVVHGSDNKAWIGGLRNWLGENARVAVTGR